MKPQKKRAIELYEKFKPIINSLNNGFTNHDEIKECAIICNHEILNTIPFINNTLEQTKERLFLIEVTQEIRKL